MSRKIIIDPVTRVEGHGKVTIHLNEDGQVDKTYFHIVEFRGFERFIQGHPYWEAPVLVQRLCGICPVSHHLAASKAIDQLVGITPESLPPSANALRRLLHYAQIFQSHALHFFYLASPDLLFGVDAPGSERNVMQVAIANKELARKGILMRKFGQELIRAIAGKRIHGLTCVPGGVHKALTQDEINYFLDGKAIPSIEEMIKWSQEILGFIKQYDQKHRAFIDDFANLPSGHLGMVSEDGAMELYHGRLRAIDACGNTTLDDVATDDYQSYFGEHVERWSYMKFPYLKKQGLEKGWNRVGPLARMNVCSFIPTPLAEFERQIFFSETGSGVNNRTMHTHWARLIELLHCAELMKDLLHDPLLKGITLAAQGSPQNEGIGILEAPRGTLIHHYSIDDHGMITRCNLIVSTTHNNEAMNRTVNEVAKKVISSEGELTEGMLNQVEVAIRAYDPCLSCATQALGQMPLKLELFNAQNQLIQTLATS